MKANSPANNDTVEYEKFREEQNKLSKEASLKEIEEDIKRLKTSNP